jgi:hypothetical protein
MNGKLLAIPLLITLCSGATAMSDAQSQLQSFLPDTVQGWRASGHDRTFDGDNLFDYIDGGAELYLSYGFRLLISREYKGDDPPDIIVDVFDMGTSENAFGVFSHSRETMDESFGQGSQYTEGLLLFWKDRYYVSILASPETETSKEACLSLASHISGAIPGTGRLPAVVDLLPEESLVPETIRYFHHYVWLNSHYFIADENILHIDESTHAVLAKYGAARQRSILLIVQYANVGDAAAGHADFERHYLPDKSDGDVVQIEDETWAGCRLTGPLLTVVLAAPTEDAARLLMDAVREKAALRGLTQPEDIPPMER